LEQAIKNGFFGDSFFRAAAELYKIDPSHKALKRLTEKLSAGRVGKGKGGIGKLLITDLKVIGADDDLGVLIGNYILAEAKKKEGLKVVDLKSVKDMLKQQQFAQLIGCSEASCLGDLGKALDVEATITGTLQYLEGRFYLTLNLLRNNPFVLEKTVIKQVSGSSYELIAGAREAMMELLAY
jgi:hypothetical protein